MICDAIQKLMDYGLQNDLIQPEDRYVVQNQYMEIFQMNDWQTSGEASSETEIDAILQPLIDYACAQHLIPDTGASRDLFDTRLMGVLTPMPREVMASFRKHYAVSPEAATGWYYAFSQNLNYVRRGRIAKDLKWTYASEYGTLDITINRSKPEKDPRDIAAAKSAKASAYPKCQLCPENAGFAGNLKQPARQNLRPVSLQIQGEPWQLQYSPYGYYHEHCIVFNEKHTAMKIDAAVFEKLFDVLDILPHYFIGSNADLPIVGGSILSHEHFQGGNYTFAMAKAPIEKYYVLPQFPDVQVGIVKWPMSVIRLQASNRSMLAAACSKILEKWRTYSDASVQILDSTDGVPHNTITPIARMHGSTYECDLVLRNNRTTEERPLGLFHPNPSLHHIKKENIGLIEVMGLAVLPSRLAVELDAVRTAMLSGADLTANPLTASHADWAVSILKQHPEFSAGNAWDILHAEVGKVFEQVLLDAGVFRRSETGKAAFVRFMESLWEE
ncbi:UDP-glucose--hexose-1-phosphate uridylyltransferase [uncultured Ruminococcus sp.]|jgi:UDPglucose--hexose-1-phosphate uridylyltransferase|uniref:UDP-glucose--hexose-1-phosphate uridylyltransferase n=1 Tax=uncultured Ruminococcus sp. TaxID=165186 RepID=UPI002804B73C|nr:UDP-glucose--hexose-1-phosphate uridylyltransferase [uncultured Ruminococcus sp.]